MATKATIATESLQCMACAIRQNAGGTITNYYNIFSICEFLLYKFFVGNIIDSSKNSSIVIKLFNTAL